MDEQLNIINELSTQYDCKYINQLTNKNKVFLNTLVNSVKQKKISVQEI